jgi:hypothetical protein
MIAGVTMIKTAGGMMTTTVVDGIDKKAGINLS